MTPATLSALMPWCSSGECIKPGLCIPRLLGQRWVATDGRSIAWCPAEAGDRDLLEVPPPDATAIITRAEEVWPGYAAGWRAVGVPTLPAGTLTRCRLCEGTGFILEEDDQGKPTGAAVLAPCDNCEGTGRTLERGLRLDCQPPGRAIALDLLLRIAPLTDRIAWSEEANRSGALLIQSRLYRALIMPTVGYLDGAVVLPTVAAPLRDAVPA